MNKDMTICPSPTVSVRNECTGLVLEWNQDMVIHPSTTH